MISADSSVSQLGISPQWITKSADTVRMHLINLAPPPSSKEISNKKNQIAIDWSSLISFSLFHCNYSLRNGRCFLVIAGRPAGVTATRGASLPFFLSPSSSLHDQGQL